MKILIKTTIFVILISYLVNFSINRVFAATTDEYFTSTITYNANWLNVLNLIGVSDSQYASIVKDRLTLVGNTGESFDVPIGSTIDAVSIKIYQNSSGNSGSPNYMSITSKGSGESCYESPNFALNNIDQTIIFDSTTCERFSSIATVPKINSSHFGWYITNSGTKNASFDAISMWADYTFAPATLNAELTPGSVWEWTDIISTPVKKEGLENIVSVSVGYNHNLALKSDGTVWAWGNNQHGQLGNGEMGGHNSIPTKVKSSNGQEYLAGIIAVSAGNHYSMALQNDGVIWIWGFNGSDERGTGVGLDDLVLPIKVRNLSQITAIKAGGNHSLALNSDGKVFAWGNNSQGQVETSCYFPTCGNSIRYPKQVFDDVKSIAAGDYHSLVVKTDGTAWGWGRYDGGQLGSFNGDYSEGSPIQILGISDVEKILAKDSASMALTEDGKVFGWGSGRSLLYGDDANPRLIKGLNFVNNASIGVSSAFHAAVGAAVDEDGEVWIWDAQNSKGLVKLPFLSNIEQIEIGGQSNLAVVRMSEATPTPTPTEIPTPTPTPKTPLILIPGVAGSYLKTTHPFVWNENDGHGGTNFYNYGENEEVWVNHLMIGLPGDDDYLDVLRLNRDGETSLVNIVPSGKLPGDYDKTINFFVNNGYELNKTLFTFPYDWRKDLSGTLVPLDHLINTIRSQTGSQKVDIVAHSMGGLVARNYISNPSRAANVNNVFTLGTPHLGSVKLLKALKYGDNFGPSYFDGLIKLNPNEVKDIIQNFVGGFELLPSQKYFDFYTGDDDLLRPYPFVDSRDVDNNGVTGKLNYQQTKTMLTNLKYNTDLFVQAESFHSLDDNLANTNGVDVINIVGSGVSTLGQIIEKNHEDFFGNFQNKADETIINGDGTVPLFSASLNDPGRNISFLGDAKVFYAKQDHGNLVASGSALNLVKNVLNGDNQLPAGISTNPASFSGTEVSVFSPVNISVYDSLGNHTGLRPDGDFEENIPGSSYDALDDSKFIFLPDNGVYNIKFEATGKGSFDFKIRRYEDDALFQETLYKDIPLTAWTKAETQLDTSAQSPIIFLDEDGNGIIDQDISPSSNLTGDMVYDQIVPQTDIQIYGELGDRGWFKSDAAVTLIPKDDASGSGILKTEYSLDNGQTINIYSGPFTISAEEINKLKFRSTDNAGNEEDPQDIEIKIDKTPPEAKIFVDQDKQRMIVAGIDVNLTTVVRSDNRFTKKRNDAFYVITDLAGNSLKLDVREVNFGKIDSFRIYSMQYNNGLVRKIESNHFSVIYDGRRSRKNVREQNFEQKGIVEIRIRYDAKKDKSTIIVREKKREKVKEVRNGLTVLKLSTAKGQLKTEY